MYAFAPTGNPILGTLDRVEARAEITDGSFRRQPDGSIDVDWAGETEVFWDSQRTITRGGVTVYLCSEGEEWLETQLILRDDDNEEGLLEHLLDLSKGGNLKGVTEEHRYDMLKRLAELRATEGR